MSKLGLLKKNGWSQCHKVSSYVGRQSGLSQKKKEQRHLSGSPDCDMGESQAEREPHLGKREKDRDQSGSIGKERVDSVVKEGGFQ